MISNHTSHSCVQGNIRPKPLELMQWKAQVLNQGSSASASTLHRVHSRFSTQCKGLEPLRHLTFEGKYMEIPWTYHTSEPKEVSNGV